MTRLSDQPPVEWVVRNWQESIVCGHSTREAARECASEFRTHHQSKFTVEMYRLDAEETGDSHE